MLSVLNDKLRDITSGLPCFLPEFVLVLGIILILLLGLFPKTQRELWCRVTCLFFLFVTIFLDVQQWVFLTSNSQPLFQNMLLLDKAAVFWKFIFEIAALLTVFMGFRASNDKDKSSEYYVLILTVLFGAHLLAMANNLLMVFLAIELLSIGSYILTTFGFNRSATEAGIKYLLFGAAASGVMIYGMSWFYAITGSLNFTALDFSRMLIDAGSVPLIIAGVLILGGMLFKISAAPMHIWAPDVYTVAPTPVVAFFSVVPKMAGFAILIKWIMVVNLFGQSPVNWSAIMAVIAIITITVGNFSALWQRNVKRMLAYSSIAHSGFLLIGIVALFELAMQSLLFYAAVYLIMNIAAFMLIHFTERSYGFKNMEDYSGFSRTSALFTVLMVIIMISLTGLPPTGGFTAKLLIFTALWESYSLTDNSWMLFLMIFGLVNTVVSLFYYLKLPYYMIFKKQPADSGSDHENIFGIENFLSGVMVVALLIIFFKPDWLMGIINNVNFAF